MNKEKAQEIFQLLKKHYPHAGLVLTYGNHFELLAAIILSAQCTDKKVNEVTNTLFPKYRKRRNEFEKFYKQYRLLILSEQSESKDPLANDVEIKTGQKRKGFEEKYANNKRTSLSNEELIELVNFVHVPLTELEQNIKPTGFYHAKAKSVSNAAKIVLEKFYGILPKTIEQLITIPGVGRKTANVFLTNAYHIDEGIAVDTHVKKQAKLLGLTSNTDPVKIEQDLMKLFPKNQWHQLTYMLIEHGRNVRKKRSDRFLCSNKDCALCKSYR